AGEIAAGRAKGQHRRAWQKVVERLFFDWVDAKTGRTAIGREHDLAIPAAANETQTALAVVQFAVARAYIALEAPVIEKVPIAARLPLHDRLFHGTTAKLRAGILYLIVYCAQTGQLMKNIAQHAKVRLPAAAGSFYARNPIKLQSEVDDLLASVPPSQT